MNNAYLNTCFLLCCQNDNNLYFMDRGGKKDGRDITQSDVYKMIHGLDEQKQRPRMPPQYEGVPKL